MVIKKSYTFPTMLSARIGLFWILVLAGLISWFVISNYAEDAQRPFHFGLDLIGGTQLIYEADTSTLPQEDVPEAMRALRDVIERRVNVFGVGEPLVQTEKASALSGGTSTERLIVELPGVNAIEEAVAQIGKTPVLEFKLVTNEVATATEERYAETGLTGRFVADAALVFANGTGQGIPNEPTVHVNFNDEGKALFGTITKEHVGRQLAIFLDGVSISEPVIREPIEGGTAVISGNFTPEEARELVRNLNIGALPVPVVLASTNTVGATLGAETLKKGAIAGAIGMGAIMVFLVLVYRLPGLFASFALLFYLLVNLSLYQLIPVTLTASGIAGFILSLGMAVDANILIFERMRDELRTGKGLTDAITEGFARAWLPIRDGNLTGLLSAAVLYWIGTSSVQGFAFTLAIGICVSMFSALTVTRVLMLSLGAHESSSLTRLLFRIPPQKTTTV